MVLALSIFAVAVSPAMILKAAAMMIIIGGEILQIENIEKSDKRNGVFPGFKE
jgi:hypothetical protein